MINVLYEGKKWKIFFFAILIAFGFIGCGNIENGTPEEITEYIIKELAKTNKDNVQKFVYDNKEYVKKKFDAASRKLGFWKMVSCRAL